MTVIEDENDEKDLMVRLIKRTEFIDLTGEPFIPSYDMEFYSFRVGIDLSSRDERPRQYRRVVFPVVDSLVKVVFGMWSHQRNIQIKFSWPTFPKAVENLEHLWTYFKPFSPETMRFILLDHRTSKIDFDCIHFDYNLVEAFKVEDETGFSYPVESSLSVYFNLHDFPRENKNYLHLATCLRKCPRLTSLTFESIEGKGIAELHALRGHGNLKSLALNVCNKVFPVDYEDIEEMYDGIIWRALLGIHLKTLEVGRCNGSTGYAFLVDSFIPGFWNMLAQHETIQKVVIRHDRWLEDIRGRRNSRRRSVFGMVKNALLANERIISIECTDLLGLEVAWDSEIVPYLEFNRVRGRDDDASPTKDDKSQTFLGMKDHKRQGRKWMNLLIRECEYDDISAVYQVLRCTVQMASICWPLQLQKHASKSKRKSDSLNAAIGKNSSDSISSKKKCLQTEEEKVSTPKPE